MFYYRVEGMDQNSSPQRCPLDQSLMTEGRIVGYPGKAVHVGIPSLFSGGPFAGERSR